MKKITFTVFVFLFSITLLAQPNIEWQKCLGGSSNDYAYSVQQTTDGGYIIAGGTNSTDGDISGNHGDIDIWIVKLDDSEIIEWKKCLGGSKDDYAKFIQQTTDGGYIIAGYTESNDGDVSGNHGYHDYWIIKLDASGNIEWEKCLGGSDYDSVVSIQQTTDGGYIVVGSSSSLDGDVSGNHGDSDAWIVKLDESGNIKWQKCLGGSDYDSVVSIQQITDKDYIMAGYTYSDDGDVSGNHGSCDIWIVKLDTSGIIDWQKCLGGSKKDFVSFIQQTNDGGYIISGETLSTDGDVSDNHGGSDAWIVKLDESGNIEWKKCLGGSDYDYAKYIQQTTHNGYIIVGNTDSNDGDVSGNHGNSDAWIIKLDNLGNINWQKCLGGSKDDYAKSVQQTTDEGYIIIGTPLSTDGDISDNHGASDFWIVKLSKDNTDIQTISNNKSVINIYPNPVNNIATININTTESVETQMTIISITGQLISTQNISLNVGENTLDINTSSLEKGSYILKIIQNKQIIVKRFVK